MDFIEICRNLANSGRPEFKNHRIQCSQIQIFEKLEKKIKKNTIKTRANSKHSSKDFFFKSASFDWLKFKFSQIFKSGPTWP
jgi:hypothetical protein